MSSWKEFLMTKLPTDTQLIILIDPESLFLDAIPLAQESGYDVHQHLSLMALTRFFEGWKANKPRTILYVGADSKATVSYHIRQAAKELTLTWELLFPNLHKDSLRVLERDYLPVLWAKRLPARPLTTEQSMQHILDVVFTCRLRDLNSLPHFIAYAIRLHYRGLRMPLSYAQAIVRSIDHPDVLAFAPLEPLLTSTNTFMNLLQDEWAHYVHALAKGEAGGRIPFAYEDVRVYMDNLFQEGFLDPVEWHVRETIPAWVKPGLKMQGNEDDSERLMALIDRLQESCPSSAKPFSDWSHFMRTYSETLQQYYAHSREPEVRQRVDIVRKTVRKRFKEWVLSSYSAQQTRAVGTQPYMVNHIPLFMKRYHAESGKKLALVVLDCMSWDAWAIIRDYLNCSMKSLEMTETSVLAQVPSITSVSRQAIFAGTPPKNFAKSIGSTSGEGKLWRIFWETNNPQVAASYSGYFRGANTDELGTLSSELNNDILGLVVGMIDETVHGSAMGIAAAHSGLTVWLNSGWLKSLLNLLIDNDFEVLLTSDHGYVEAIGQGSPSQGALVTKRGERVRIYDSLTFCEQARNQFTESLIWKNGGMPEGYFCLIADDDKAFMPYGELAVVHGGISPEELIVPFVHIRRKQLE